MTDRRIARRSRLRLPEAIQEHDPLAVEEPLEIRVRGTPVCVTMRTPGHDFDLAAGFLFSEGLVRSLGEIGAMRHCDAEEENVVDVLPVTEVNLERLRRNFYATSSCGVCGKVAIDQVRTLAPFPVGDVRVEAETLSRLPSAMRKAQAVFAETGGLHAAALFDEEGRLLALREDVGRHNAVDKAIGAMLLEDRLPLDRHILLVSGRASFEILQKARMAAVPVVCAVSAPSSLAVDFAEEAGVTLVGFLRGSTMNVYAHAARVQESIG